MKSENIPNTDLEEEKAKCPTDTADDPHRKAVIEEAVSVKREESEMNIVEIMILRAELEEEKNQHAATNTELQIERARRIEAEKNLLDSIEKAESIQEQEDVVTMVDSKLFESQFSVFFFDGN